ncbi:MAG: energy transducer TonB [bacterium]
MREKNIQFIIAASLLLCMLYFTACSEKEENIAKQAPTASETFSKSDGAPPSDAEPQFIEYDSPPTPVGDYAAIQKHLTYPELARKAGIEGRVVIWTQIDKDGNVAQTKVKDSLGPNGCDESAMNAIKAVKWTPAMKDGEPIDGFWIAVVVSFRLK